MFRLLLALMLSLAAGAAGAQTAPAAPAQLTAAQAEQALAVLKDPAKRDQVIAVLEAIAKASAAHPPAAKGAQETKSAAAGTAAPAPGAAAPGTVAPATAPAPAEASPLQLAPDSLGAELIVETSRRLSRLSDDLMATIRAVTDFPLLLTFIEQLVTDQWSRTQLLETAWRLALVLGAGLVAQWLARRLLARPMAALARRADAAEEDPGLRGLAEAEAGQTERIGGLRPAPLVILRRLTGTAARLALLLLPVVALLAVSNGLLGTWIGAQPISRLVILGVINAYAMCRVATSLLRALAGPGSPSLLRLPAAQAEYWLRWTRVIAAIGIFGYTLAEVGLLFGLYRVAHDALIKLVVLAIYLLLSVIILQQRAVVAALIRAQADAVGPVAVVRNRLAGLWHLVAIFYLLALWAVWALEVPDGFSRLLRVVVLTAVVLAAARQAGLLALDALARWTRLPPNVAESYPGLDQRMATYHPIARAVLKAAIWAVALVLVLEIWNIDALSWFATGHVGSRLLSALGTIAVTFLFSLMVWEAVNASIQRHLARLTREAQLARSARLRTLLPMLRTALLVVIGLVAGLMVLSEIGVNIAPLLAGAGVVGIAIGFGSQKLVQDVITGLFLLLENAMQVGDVVALGGLSGVVEALSVRTIRLRAADGSVHILPFSAVTTVTNMSRDYGYAQFEVLVGPSEDPDRAISLIREVAEAMAGEDAWRGVLPEPIEIWGLDRFQVNGFVLQGRIKTVPATMRWGVRRELYRRIKHRFDELMIDSPMTSYKVLDRQAPTVIAMDGGG
jgi:small conductance mechanosensitive channel